MTAFAAKCLAGHARIPIAFIMALHGNSRGTSHGDPRDSKIRIHINSTLQAPINQDLWKILLRCSRRTSHGFESDFH